MAASLNKVILIGNLGREPEVRITQEGSKVVTLSIATSEQWRDRSTEERKERVEWHRVVVFNARLCDIAERFLKKGHKVYIEGQIQSRKWVDARDQEHRTQEIVMRYKGEIIILDALRDSQDKNTSHSTSESTETDLQDFEDEIPF
jgi:single-strand DNA-binding protein